MAAAVGNYDYLFDWVFNDAAEIEVRVGATGIDSVKGVATTRMTDTSAEAEPPTGEKYHIEAAFDFWKPTTEMSISSEALGIVARMLSLSDALADALGVLALVLACGEDDAHTGLRSTAVTAVGGGQGRGQGGRGRSCVHE